jgi:hypothetical protein
MTAILNVALSLKHLCLPMLKNEVTREAITTRRLVQLAKSMYLPDDFAGKQTKLDVSFVETDLKTFQKEELAKYHEIINDVF